ncbi:hypothetical protein JI435_159890, partial [Parastagonospora nodorum SN15]
PLFKQSFASPKAQPTQPSTCSSPPSSLPLSTALLLSPHPPPSLMPPPRSSAPSSSAAHAVTPPTDAVTTTPRFASLASGCWLPSAVADRSVSLLMARLTAFKR